MCTTNIYTYVYPDGRTEQYSQPTLCANSRHGQVCASNYVFQHPSQLVNYTETTYPTMTQLPPTPQYSPVPSTPSYRSGDESDRSYGSSSSKKKRASGLYIDGHKVLDFHHKKERRPSSRHADRIVLVDNPPTSRTPPQTWTAPHTAPASPNPNTYVVETRDASHRRPVIVDDRAKPERHIIEVVDNHRSSKHVRHASSSSRDSRHSDSEEARKIRREQKREEKRREEAAQRLAIRIAEANAEIAGRPAVPAPPRPRRASTYKRPSVEVLDREAELVEAVRRLNFEEERREEKARKLAKKEEKKEEEAQRKRLMERMQPKRRATVGPGSRRQRVLYDDGVYRWE
ncbi:hypothetical protein FSOLCH5_003299 [Fusarium solani]|jgi:hypothetical protein|uniref:Uncharacterized protein n=1 Tax=Fusarium solani TaxID=169388 RepID=A0A9P9RBL9_FUSSL|nr:uncharacterized protein B0J15DRAFT_193572 [Fusarium solani]KAH7273037.1 hypothetical protein B0J15DRAFT_193572 [Fusarium solani]KAJ4211078.1 hypothetical protein NW759_012831 [Fusarium solani]